MKHACSNNKYPGISLASDNSSVYHNNFVNNGQDFVEGEYQVWSFQKNNTWDSGYPSGGDYWSDYTGADVKSGPNQDQPNSDWIGDTPYVINSINEDRYPLMNPYVLPDTQLLYYELLANYMELQSEYNNLVAGYDPLHACMVTAWQKVSNETLNMREKTRASQLRARIYTQSCPLRFRV